MSEGNDGAPVYVESAGLAPVKPGTPRMRARWVVPPVRTGWESTAVSEWELIRAGIVDLHPHEEAVYVLEGELHVEANGVVRVCRAGDYVCVPKGSVGRYWAPEYARMIGIYGPNPFGEISQYIEYWEIEG